MRQELGLVVLLACNGDGKDDHITPLEDADADADADTDADADSDADTDTGTTDDPCAPLPPPSGATVDLAPGAILADEVAAAAPGTTLLLADGTYIQRAPVLVDKAITIRSASGNRAAVVVDGQHATGAGNLFEVQASDVTIAHLTLRSSWDDLVHVQPVGADVTGVRLHDVHLLDPGRVGVQIEGDGADHWVDDGEISCSLVELSAAGRNVVRGGCDTGGVDASSARGWEVHDTTVDGFWCPFGLARPAIRFWRGARETTVTRNVVADSPYGIVMGETQDALGRTYADDPCGGLVQSIDGVVTNNIVFAYDDDLVYSGEGVLVGIRADSSCNVQIVHNSVYSGVTPDSSSIEHRYATTTGVVANNLVSDSVRRLDDSAAAAEANHESATFDMWYFPAGGDFHTSPGATLVIDQGSTTYTLPEDIDREPRDDGLPDIGADEK